MLTVIEIDMLSTALAIEQRQGVPCTMVVNRAARTSPNMAWKISSTAAVWTILRGCSMCLYSVGMAAAGFSRWAMKCCTICRMTYAHPAMDAALYAARYSLDTLIFS